MTQLDQLTEKLVTFDDKQLFLHLGMSSESASEDLEQQTRSASIDSIDLSVYEITRGNVDILNWYWYRVIKARKSYGVRV